MRAFARIGQVARFACVVGLLVVVVGSLTPAAEMPSLEASDKVQHFGAYAVLALCGVLGWPRGRPLALVVGGLIAAGLCIELLQMLVPGRSAEFADGVADIAGVAVGAATALLLRRMLAPERTVGPPAREVSR